MAARGKLKRFSGVLRVLILNFPAELICYRFFSFNLDSFPHPLISCCIQYQSMSGVLKTEIDPLQPRVTVVGNVDPQILIKKLSKAGKQAELWKQLGNEKAANGNKQVANKTNEKEKSESVYKKSAKCPDSSSCDNDSGSGSSSTEKVVVKEIPDSGDKRGPEHDQTEIGGIYEVTENKNAILPTNHEGLARSMVHDKMKVRTCTQQCCMAEPPQLITLPYYAIHSYAATAALFPSPCYAQANYHYEMAMYQPPFQAPATQVGDYFSDENTVGCSVM
ncbi:heavy metal-associated isoprenylated plant protein 36 isoform X1 [Ziziphus jujuba]|uniref:Heavy metal-associated isoprenylated plant protein 36 isoform X1 n=1 Tax=Ziziphus jujuba TaxID=326968 RepID=A0ABM3IX26_ZIZJJ|nr:heavy metal-associated isoprenylated plant protein 36 isoform X1 [Ziziphus jujuba]